ncbi:MAG: lipid A deacylase LpxR family protein [Proteobacteria bacterium]|nr:lipid A deacylase LpxR family protein [Pseudomonadota bacterium]
MRLAWGTLAVVAALVCSTGVHAQRSVFVGENDAVNKTDRDYTNGFRQSFIFDNFSKDLLAAQLFDFVKPALITAGSNGGPARQQLEWIALAQSIFTPDHTTALARLPGDRPFAGWLYTGFNISQETDRKQLDTFELLAGAVGGEDSLANDVQSAFHRLLGQSPPVINGYTLHNEPGLLVAWDRRWKTGVAFGDGYGIDLIPSVGFTGGNVFTYGSAGAIARIGRSLSTTWGPTTVRPAPSGASFVSPNPDAPFWGFDFFGGFEGRAVARNIFLDGNTFENSIHVTRNPFVLDLVVGAEVRIPLDVAQHSEMISPTIPI